MRERYQRSPMARGVNPRRGTPSRAIVAFDTSAHVIRRSSGFVEGDRGVLRRGVRTAQRWERDAGLPVRRVGGYDGGAVYAFRSELDAWWQQHARLDIVSSAAAGRAPLADALAPASSHAADSKPARPRVRPFLSHDVRVDPDSAPGHADLAVYFFTLTIVGLMRPDDGMSRRRAVRRTAPCSSSRTTPRPRRCSPSSARSTTTTGTRPSSAGAPPSRASRYRRWSGSTTRRSSSTH